jgi:hypothetical protein
METLGKTGWHNHKISCVVCSKEFQGAVLSKYCSKECKSNSPAAETSRQINNLWHRNHPSYKKVPLVTIACAVCGGCFETNQSNSKYCSDDCRREIEKVQSKTWNRVVKYTYVRKGLRTHQKTCPVCASKYIGAMKSKYCSRACRRKSPLRIMKRHRDVKRRKDRYASDPVYRAMVRKRSSLSVMKSFRKNPVARIKLGLRKRVRSLIKSKGFSVSALVGCNSITLRSWLEEKFKRGMTWDNYGRVWVVDHKIPLASFDLSIPEQRAIACHYTNLQPLTHRENSEKGDSITDGQFALRM